MGKDDDTLDVSLVDWELLTEVELMVDVVIGAQAASEPLGADEVDRLLGLSAPGSLGRLTVRGRP